MGLCGKILFEWGNEFNIPLDEIEDMDDEEVREYAEWIYESHCIPNAAQ